MSNTELTGPSQSIKRLMPDASHRRGVLSSLSSTRSQDRAVQHTS